MVIARRRWVPALIVAAALVVAGAIAAAFAGASGALRPKRLDLTGWTPTLDEAFDRRVGGGPPGARGLWRTTFHHSPPETINARNLSSNGEKQVYVDPGFRGLGLNPFQYEGPTGVAILADRAPPSAAAALEGHPYTSGLLTTHDSFRQLYGYFEVTAQIPRGKGLWPCIWLMPQDGSWPPELDIMEALGDRTDTYVGTVHSRGSPRDAHAFRPGLDLAAAPRTYGVAWGPRETVWYLDRREVGRSVTPPDMSQPAYLLLNLAVGGLWSGQPDSATVFPAKFRILRVRAYSPPPGWRG